MLYQRMDGVVSATGPRTAGKLERPEADVVLATNRARREHDRRPLETSARLTRAAQARAAKLARGGEFSHDGWEDALRKVGYRTGWGAGENIAYGQDSAAEVVEDWLASPGHRRNILDKAFKMIGVAYVSGGDQAGGRDVWVQVFGRR